MIERIEPLGRLIADCPFPGETRADDVWPAHPNAIQVSKDRFLVVYATRGYRGGDDDLSIVYQLRAGALDGPVLAERMVASTRNDWEPFGDSAHYVLQNGHPAAFGVPRGALIGGKPAPNANLFVIKWHYLARYLDPDTGILVSNHDTPGLMERTLRVGWTQLRLNDAADDLEIVYGPPSVRRRYLNILISQTDREYLGAVQRYERVVRQRNHLLRQIREGTARVAELAFWDDELVKEGSRIVARRLETVRMLSESAGPMHAGLSGGMETLAVEYIPNVELPHDASGSGIERALHLKLKERRGQELARGMTVTGPHRDDLSLTIGGMDVSGFASRGQTRTVVLALKLAEAAYLREMRQREPVILLDDVLSELDSARREQVLGHAAQYHQALITTADADAVAAQLPTGTRRFRVERGKIGSLDQAQ